jgi:hypothetical protein
MAILLQVDATLDPASISRIPSVAYGAGIRQSGRPSGLRARGLSRPLRLVGEVGVAGGHRLDAVALALGLGADAAALLDRRDRGLVPRRRSAAKDG